MEEKATGKYRVQIGYGFGVYEVDAIDAEEAEDLAWELFHEDEATGGSEAFCYHVEEID